MTAPLHVSPTAFLEVHKTPDRLTQLSICDEKGSGYRIAGPRFLGRSATVICHLVTERDAKEIRTYLDRVFPPPSPRDDLRAQWTQWADFCHTEAEKVGRATYARREWETREKTIRTCLEQLGSVGAVQD